jgi:hypothetical protein
VSERDVTRIDVDQLWLQEWAEAGLAAIEAYLAKHAAFVEFLQRQADLRSSDDGGARSV